MTSLIPSNVACNVACQPEMQCYSDTRQQLLKTCCAARPDGGDAADGSSPDGSAAPAPVLITTVDIGEGRSDVIELLLGDDPTVHPAA